jgi:hypothetical protein
MRNAKVVAALAAGLFALVGCTSESTPGAGGQSSGTAPSTTSAPPSGSTSASTPPGSTGAPTPPEQSTAPPLPGATEVPPPKVDGSTLPDTYKKTVTATADGRTLQVIGQAGGCKVATAEVTAQAADSVLVTLVTTYYPPAGGGVCTQEIRDVPLTVALDAPLADRRVVLEARQETA